TQTMPPNPNLKIIAATPSTFRAETATDGRFFIFGTVGGGLLRFEVIARLHDGTRSAVSGREFFDAMMDHFGIAVRAIEGHWDRQSGLTTNLDLFNAATAAGLTAEQAALVATKTGRWADNRGFSVVQVIDLDPPGATGM